MTSFASPSRISPSRAVNPKHTVLLSRLKQGLHADLQDYRRLQKVLAMQFEAIVQHRSKLLEDIAAKVVKLVEEMEARKKERVQIVVALLGRENPPSMEALLSLLPKPYNQLIPPLWQELGTLVKDCKELNTRNCNLLTAQNEIMQQVLNGEADTYAPV